MSTEHVPLANLAMSNDKDAVPETGPKRILQLSTRKIKYRIVMKKFIIQQQEYFRQQSELEFKEETSILLHMEHSFVWCWRRMGKFSWGNRVKNEVLHRVKKDRNILHTLKRRKTN